MSYRNYQYMMGFAVQEQLEAKLTQLGLHEDHFVWKEKDLEGYGTMTLKDSQPIYLQFYLPNYHEQTLLKWLGEKYPGITLVSGNEGNGHGCLQFVSDQILNNVEREENLE